MDKCCNRPIVDILPEKAWPAMCGGKKCNHRTIYVLEDCRQTIIIKPDDRVWPEENYDNENKSLQKAQETSSD